MERADCTPLRRPTGDTDRRLVILAPEDSVCIACTYLPAGAELLVDGVSLTLPQPISLGHKIARQAIAVGEKIVKYGAKIGSATTAITAGEHVHTHNMKSDYIPTFTPEDEQRYTGGRGA